MSLLTRLARRGGHRHHRLLAQRTVSPFISGRVDHQDDNEDTNCNNGMHQQQLQRRTISIASQRQLHSSSLCHQSSMNSSQYLLASSSASFTNNNHMLSMSCTTARAYHTTPKNQILPFLAVGVLGASAVYTYRTFQQMDQDWDDYYDAVEEYNAMTGIDIDPATQSAAAASASSGSTATATASMNCNDDLSAYFTGGTMAIDLGTTRLKLSHRPSLLANANNDAQQQSTSKSIKPSVSVDREGFRSTPSLLWMPLLSSQNESSEEVLTGRLAQARMYDTKNGSIVHPREALSLLEGTANVERAIESSIRVVASNALDQALGGTSPSSSSQRSGTSGSDKPLFVLDASMAESSESYNVRPIFTYPPQYEQEEQSTTTLEEYKRSMNNLTSPAGIAEFVSEPVAIVTGAEYYNLLPPKGNSAAGSGSGTSVLVIDVGGSSTCISMVNSEEDTVMYSTSLPFGGDTFIDLLVSHLVQGFYNGPNDTATASAASEEEASDVILSTKPNLNDATALQRLYESSTTAIHELSNKTRSEINIPYLTMDLETRQPKHLEVGMARTVVNGQVEAWVRDRLVPHLQQHTDNSQSSSSSSLSGAAISQALPPPTNLSTLVSSTIMSSLESTSQTPHDLRAILLVGGGARIPLVREAVNEGVSYLAGDAYANGSGSGSGGGGEEKRLIMPEGEMGEELAVLGAVVWGSGGR